MIGLMLAGALAIAASYTPAQAPAAQRSEPIYGYTMMTDQERNEYRQKMRDAQSAQERQALRDEHRATMEARMRERGINPSQMRGGGMGPGGPAMGPAPGKGNGPGPRRGPPQG
jgi:uncharacterized membrane protein